MKEWCVIYSSLTGNTKLIAEAMAAEADADLFSVEKAPEDLSSYEAVALGYWLRRLLPRQSRQRTGSFSNPFSL